jgi:hypothetical protein
MKFPVCTGMAVSLSSLSYFLNFLVPFTVISSPPKKSNRVGENASAKSSCGQCPSFPAAPMIWTNVAAFLADAELHVLALPHLQLMPAAYMSACCPTILPLLRCPKIRPVRKPEFQCAGSMKYHSMAVHRTLFPYNTALGVRQLR